MEILIKVLLSICIHYIVGEEITSITGINYLQFARPSTHLFKAKFASF